MPDGDPPPDIQRCIDFHGHLCGGLTIGYLMARAAMEYLAITRAEDEELVAIVENDSCAADAVQLLTGCTFGKGNLIFRDYGKMALTLWDRAGARGVRVVRRSGTRGKSTEELLATKTEVLFDSAPAEGDIPEKARIHDSETCALCGEETMVTRLADTARGQICIACAEKGDQLVGHHRD